MPEGPQGLAAAPEEPKGLAAAPVGGGAWPDNEPTRRSKLAARTAEVGGADTTASQVPHAIPPQYESRQAQKSQNINDQNTDTDMRSRELHAELLVVRHR